MDEQEEFEFRLRLEREQSTATREPPRPEQIAARGAFEQARYDRLNAHRSLRPALGQGDVNADVGMSVLSSMIATPVSGIAGIFGGDVEKVADKLTYRPRTIEGEKAVGVINWPFEKLAQGADWAGGKVAEATDSPALGAAVNTAIQAAPAILAKGRGTRTPSRPVAAAEGAPKPASVPKRPTRLGDVPPTIDELGAQSKEAYKRASDAGVSIAPASFENLKTGITQSLTKEGLDSTLHPQTTAALKRISETEGAVTLDQLETLRKIANDARGGVNKADTRMAGKVVDAIDEYMDGIGRKDITTGDPKAFAALKEGRNLWSRKSKAEEIARLVKRAELSAPNFSASGMENALRTEFRALAKNDKKMRRFTKEERAAIERVAQGGKMENILRYIGKAAPTGLISGSLGVAAAGAIPGGWAIPATGMAARYGATRMTRANALRAEEIMRRGPRNHLRPEDFAERNQFLEQMY